MMQVLLVALGGALGSVARYGVGVAAARVLGLGFPFGTLTVNIIGSLLMGVLAARVGPEQENLRLAFGVGILGGFTTFSAFSLDFALLVERKAYAAAGAYAAGSVLFSLAAVFAGLHLVRTLAQ